MDSMLEPLGILSAAAALPRYVESVVDTVEFDSGSQVHRTRLITLSEKRPSAGSVTPVCLFRDHWPSNLSVMDSSGRALPYVGQERERSIVSRGLSGLVDTQIISALNSTVYKPSPQLPSALEQYRAEIRAFVAEELNAESPWSPRRAGSVEELLANLVDEGDMSLADRTVLERFRSPFALQQIQSLVEYFRTTRILMVGPLASCGDEPYQLVQLAYDETLAHSRGFHAARSRRSFSISATAASDSEEYSLAIRAPSGVQLADLHAECSSIEPVGAMRVMQEGSAHEPTVRVVAAGGQAVAVNIRGVLMLRALGIVRMLPAAFLAMAFLFALGSLLSVGATLASRQTLSLILLLPCLAVAATTKWSRVTLLDSMTLGIKTHAWVLAGMSVSVLMAVATIESGGTAAALLLGAATAQVVSALLGWRRSSMLRRVEHRGRLHRPRSLDLVLHSQSGAAASQSGIHDATVRP